MVSQTKKDSRGSTRGKLPNGKGWLSLKFTAKMYAPVGMRFEYWG